MWRSSCWTHVTRTNEWCCWTWRASWRWTRRREFGATPPIRSPLPRSGGNVKAMRVLYCQCRAGRRGEHADHFLELGQWGLRGSEYQHRDDRTGLRFCGAALLLQSGTTGLSVDTVDDGVQSVREWGDSHSDLQRLRVTEDYGRAELCLQRQVFPTDAISLQHLGLLADYDSYPVYHGFQQRLPLLHPARPLSHHPLHYLRYEDALLGLEEPQPAQHG